VTRSDTLKFRQSSADKKGVSQVAALHSDYVSLALGSLKRLPPFSPVLNRLLSSLANEEVSFGKMAELIEKDTVLTGHVLSMVNSAAYARVSAIVSVRHAVSLLGVLKLRNLVLGLSISRLWANVQTPSGWSHARFNLHSITAATLADLLAQKVPVAFPEGAFIAGLLHDFGKLLIAIALPREYGQIQQLRRSGAPEIECEMEVLGITHAELSQLALRAWNVPPAIQDAVRRHHDLRPTGSSLDLAAMIGCADAYLNATGMGMSSSILSEPETAIALLEPLEINDCLAAVLDLFATEVEAIRSFF